MTDFEPANIQDLDVVWEGICSTEMRVHSPSMTLG